MSLAEIVEVVDKIDQKKESNLKGIRSVDHMNTKTTQTTMKISRLMERELKALLREIVQMLSDGKPLDEVREKHKKDVGTIIAGGIRESYMLGIQFIQKFAERSIRLTPEHLLEIDAQIQTAITRFWGSVEAGIRKDKEEEDVKVFGAAIFDGDLFTRLTAFLTNSSNSNAFLALNTGTLTTSRQVFKETALGDAITITGSIEIPKLIWITERDDRVCPICEPLDAQTWNIDEGNIPRPVQDTHIGCRCRLLPLEKGKVFNA